MKIFDQRVLQNPSQFQWHCWRMASKIGTPLREMLSDFAMRATFKRSARCMSVKCENNDVNTFAFSDLYRSYDKQR